MVEGLRQDHVPDHVSVLGLEFDVLRVDLADADGLIDPRAQRIVLDGDLKGARADQTFLHELVHGILDQLGYSELYQDEHLVQGLAVGLYEALWR